MNLPTNAYEVKELLYGVLGELEGFGSGISEAIRPVVPKSEDNFILVFSLAFMLSMYFALKIIGGSQE